jgi:hypothetical protein
MFFKWKVHLLKRPRINFLWRYWTAWRGKPVGHYHDLLELIRKHAPGRSFVDIGCMWGVNGAHAFAAEAAGAAGVKGVDVFGPTPEFEAEKKSRGSSVEFLLGDAGSPEMAARIGVVDVVFCAGVLYHHPSPFDLLVALRRICRETLILRTSTIPEIKGLPHAAVYFPGLAPGDRQLWNLSSLGLLHQEGISNAFSPAEGYGNWFWGLTPSCLVALLQTAGFRVDYRATEPFAQTVVCSVAAIPFHHRLPGEAEAREAGQEISASGVSRPA